MIVSRECQGVSGHFVWLDVKIICTCVFILMLLETYDYDDKTHADCPLMSWLIDVVRCMYVLAK